MSAGRYFQDELETLRTYGVEFAHYFPKLSSYLSETSTDPDVERLLEGFALLTGRLREKIDDQLPEVTQSLLMLLWPNFLRPVPSMTILEFPPVKGAINERHILPADMTVDSVMVEGTTCRFRTASPLDILPLQVSDTRHDVSREKSVVTVMLDTLADEPISKINMKSLNFHLGGGEYTALTLNLWMHRYLKSVRVVNRATNDAIAIDKTCIIQGGLASGEALLPYPKNAFVGYRLLQELLSFPQKFHFLDLKSVPQAHVQTQTGFDLQFEFSRPLPPDVRVSTQAFRLHCVPAINLFKHDSEPLILAGKRTEYQVQPALRDAGEIEIFSIDTVTGWYRSGEAKSGGMSREFPRFESFSHEIEGVGANTATYFREKVRQRISGFGLERLISFVREDEVAQVGNGETISIDLTCSNGTAPSVLAVGDICVPGPDVPSFVKPKNVTRPTVPRYPVIDGTLQWQLISALSLNYVSLQNADALRLIIGLYDFNAKVDRQKEREAILRLEGLESVTSTPIDRMFRGLPVRGMKSVIRMRESKFSNEGEMYLFATVLAEFFALYASVNSFHELHVHAIETGEEHRWTARIGNQPLI